MADLKIHANFKPLGADLNVRLPEPGAKNAQSFGNVLAESMGEVSRLQLEADRSIEALASGNNKNIHETMMAISKADLAFRMTMQVRNKVMEAYQEVMRMTL